MRGAMGKHSGQPPSGCPEPFATAPLALVAMRLCDVAPDGSSLLLSRGVLNLTHRESHEHPASVPMGKRLVVRVELRVLGQAVPAGHRLRLSVAPGYWPWAWPSPERLATVCWTPISTCPPTPMPRRRWRVWGLARD